MKIRDYILCGHVEVCKITEQRRVLGAARGFGQLSQCEGRQRQPLPGRQRREALADIVGDITQIKGSHVAKC